MSTIEQRIARNRDAAAQIIANFHIFCDRTRSDPMLSQHGKAVAIGDLFASTRQRLGELRDAEPQIVAERIDALERGLFTSESLLDSGLVARRDAEDRADRLETADEAMAAHRRATQARDAVLTRAILRRAVDTGWSGVLDQHVMSRPEDGPRLRELISLQQDSGDPMLTAMHYHLSEPAEAAAQRAFGQESGPR